MLIYKLHGVADMGPGKSRTTYMPLGMIISAEDSTHMVIMLVSRALADHLLIQITHAH